MPLYTSFTEDGQYLPDVDCYSHPSPACSSVAPLLARSFLFSRTFKKRGLKTRQKPRSSSQAIFKIFLKMPNFTVAVFMAKMLHSNKKCFIVIKKVTYELVFNDQITERTESGKSRNNIIGHVLKPSLC
jgi:hypothetical protein